MSQPNIVFILSDEHNHKVIANSGDDFIKTPNLDRLAEQGVRFDNAYSNSPLCVPARMALLSGQLPLDNGVLLNPQTLDAQVPTYAHSMTIGGYQTVLAGRMHLHGVDQYRGHEKRLTGDALWLHSGDDTLGRTMGDKFKKTVPLEREAIALSGAGHSIVDAFDRSVTSDTIRFLEQRCGKSPHEQRPLMLTVGLFAPHPPFIADPELYRYYLQRLPHPPQDSRFLADLHPALLDWKRNLKIDDVKSEEWRRVRAAYYANVEIMDKNIGKIIAAARRYLGEDTIIIYSSDHGDSIGINGFIWKGNFLDSSVKIPLIAAGAGIAAGRTIAEPVCLNDLTRTFIDYGGGPELPKPFGTSLRPALEQRDSIDPLRPIISQLGFVDESHAVFSQPAAMIRKGDYKLIHYHGYERQSLFKAADTGIDGRDLHNDPDYAAIKQQLADELFNYWDSDRAVRICRDGLENIRIMQRWAKVSRFPLIDKFYNGAVDALTGNWSMRPQDNWLEKY